MTPRQLLLVAQVAISVALSIFAGLYAKSFIHITSVPPEFTQPASVLVAMVVPTGLTSEEGIAFYEQLTQGLSEHPEVISATIAALPPLALGSGSSALPGSDNRSEHAVSWVASNFFETVGIPIVRGRDFTNTDEDIRSAVIINEVLGGLWWPGEDPIGKALTIGNQSRVVTGVVATETCTDPWREPAPCAWTPFPRVAASTTGLGGPITSYVWIRTRSRPLTFMPALRALVRDLHPDVAIAQPTTLANAIDQATAMDRVSATVSATLALFGIALLAIGAVGVFLSMVRGSVREIAIRLALGSSGRRLKWRIIVQALLVIVPGVIAGLGLARFAGSRLSAPLYGIDAMDPMTFAAASGLIISIGLVAAWYAASVAARTDVAHQLRAE